MRGLKRGRSTLALLVGLCCPSLAHAGPPEGKAPPAAPAQAAATPAACPVAAVLGSADAPVTVDLFVDAAAQRDALVAFVEIRRLVADLGPDLNARVQFFIPARGTSAGSRRTAALLSALMAGVGPERTLRALDHDGWSRIDTILLHDQQPELFGIEPAELSQARAASECFAKAHGAQEELLAERYERWGSINMGVFFGLQSDEASILYTGNTEDVRLTKGRLRADVHEHMRLASRPAPPTAAPHGELPVPQGSRFVGATSQVDGETPAAPIGGVGLEHDLVLFADSEDDHTLTTLLPLALGIRAQQPGVLSIRIVARGIQGPGRRLRSRLCAARAIGRELDYIRYLSRSLNERAGPREEAFLSRLDTAAHQNECSQDPQSQRGLPRGASLDGHLGVNRTDLEAIAASQTGNASRSHAGISDWLWASPGGI